MSIVNPLPNKLAVNYITPLYNLKIKSLKV